MVRAANKENFPTRVLAMTMQVHLTARRLRQEGAYGAPVCADRSLSAGSGHSNNLARAVVYPVLEQMCGKLPRAVPRSWFGDIRVQLIGSKAAIRPTIVKAAHQLCLSRHSSMGPPHTTSASVPDKQWSGRVARWLTPAPARPTQQGKPVDTRTCRCLEPGGPL